MSDNNWMHESSFIGQIIEENPARHSNVFRFGFIPGKSRAHSRKVWRERMSDDAELTRLQQIVWRLLKVCPDPQCEDCVRIRGKLDRYISEQQAVPYALRASEEASFVKTFRRSPRILSIGELHTPEVKP